MIISFYDKKFKGLQDNASLVVDNGSYSLVLRGVEMDELKCTCEAFTEDIQPTFVVLKNDRGNYVYGALAGIPQLDKNNQTKITASDLKVMLKSDVYMKLDYGDGMGGGRADVKAMLREVFSAWDTQVNKGSFQCEFVFDTEETIPWDKLIPTEGKKRVYNVWDDILAPYLKYYALYMTSRIDLANKKVIFTVGQSLLRPLSVKLWEIGVCDYGKWIATVNETQGYVVDSQTGEVLSGGTGYRWILDTENKIMADGQNKIFPIRRKVLIKETDDSTKLTELLNEVNSEALKELTGYMYAEDLEVTAKSVLDGIQAVADRNGESVIEAGFKTKFNIVISRGAAIYKSLPCGELHFDGSGLKKVKIGFRFTGLQFIL